MTALPDTRTSPAKISSAGTTPARPSMRNSTRSALAMAASVCLRMRAVSPVSPGSNPAVSMSRTLQAPSVVSASRRSRVKPGWSSTSASFRPTNRLNRVDLPTFGRPTMATVNGIGRRPCGHWRGRDGPREGLVEGDQRGVVGKDIHAPAGDNRRNENRRVEIELGKQLARARIGADEKALARDEPELAAGEHRAAPAAARKLRHPPHLAVGAGERNKLAADIDHIDGIARDPRHLGAGKISRPQPLARRLGDCDHLAAVADHEDHSVIDDRPRRIAENAGGRGIDLARQRVAPGRFPARNIEGEDVAGRKGRDHDTAAHRRADTAEKGCSDWQPARGPKLLAVTVAEGIKHVAGRYEIDLAARGCRRAADRLANALGPNHGAIAGIEGNDGAIAGRYVEAPAVESKPAAKAFFGLLVVGGHVLGPNPRAIRRGEGRHRSAGIEREDLAVGNQRHGAQAPAR